MTPLLEERTHWTQVPTPVAPLAMRLWALIAFVKEDNWREIFHVAVLLAQLVFHFNKAFIQCGADPVESFLS